jgi:uncharacterized protein
MQTVQEISRRVQAQNPPLDQPETLQKVASETLLEILEAVAKQYQPEAKQPVLQVPVADIAALVELVARDFRETFSEKVPWGKTVTLGRLFWWKQKGELGWRVSEYLWQLNRIRRLLFRPFSSLVQELQDSFGQNLATKSMEGLKLWAVDYCITKAGHYAIQLYGNGFLLEDEHRPRVSTQVAGIPFEQEPLQILVMGQVKSGKSSLINAILGEMRAPVDALPTTDTVNLYECQPESLPPILLRESPGYGAVGDTTDPFPLLCRQIQECDVLLLVCNACSAARKADQEMLRKISEFYARDPRQSMPPVVYVLTHIDRIPENFAAEAKQAVAEDLGVFAPQIASVCAQWGRLANLDGVLAAIGNVLPEAERLKVFRCIRQIRQAQAEDQVFHQILNGLRLTGGWIAGKK